MMNWRTPLSALAGVVGVAVVALSYILVLNSPPAVPHAETSSPVLTATNLSGTADLESSPGVEPRPPASYDKGPDPADITASGPEAMLHPADKTATIIADAPAGDPSLQGIVPHPAGPRVFRPADHRANGAVTSAELARVKSDLQLSKDQLPKWSRLVAALRQAGKIQPEVDDAGRPPGDDGIGDGSSDLQAHALPFLLSLSNDQLRGAGRLASILGFKSPSAMADAVRAAAAAHRPAETPVAVTPAPPPMAKPPAVADQRYEGLLTRSEIGRIKVSLKLTPNQESLWPPVAAILGELGQQQMAQVDAGQKLDTAMSGPMAQRFYNAALPLLQTLTDDQKAEVRRRARSMGLEAYAAYL